MLKYSINILIIFLSISLYAQEKEIDSIVLKDRYGLRVGIDLFRPIVSFFDEDSNGFEIVADYRISKRFYAATEFGFSDITDQEDFFKYSANGSYIKLGVDYNSYKNWVGMENMIIVGLRYGYSSFNQTINEYTINADPFLPEQNITTPTTYNNLSAQWIEFVLGLKVEVLHNIFLGFTFRGKQLITAKEIENFKILYIPGFNKVFLNDNGFGFNYTVSYLIPLYKKKH